MNNVDRTFIGMPGYGKQTSAAGRGLWRARRDMANVSVEYRQGSLLAANFNALWCSALNIEAEQGLRYFAMLHDDVGPSDFWLDDLIEEMETKDLDVLGVALPIKDRQGLTSLAIDGDSTWRPRCRLTMHEVLGLPETFTSEDVGGDLLINTGCWVCKFDPKWARQVHFTVNDRIVYNTKLEQYQAEVEPEDWFFSRLCHEIGLKVGATSKIGAFHRGESDFSNQMSWGQAYDSMYVDASPIGWRFAYNVEGWLTYDEGKHLAELAQGKRVLEIGAYCGRSTICMAQTAEEVVSVDPHDGRGTPEPRPTYAEFQNNLKAYDINNVKSYFHIEDTTGLFDLVFIDAAHDLESVKQDIADALERLAPGGLIAFHDYGEGDPEVVEAVDNFIREGAEPVSQQTTVIVIRPSATKPMETA